MEQALNQHPVLNQYLLVEFGLEIIYQKRLVKTLHENRTSREKHYYDNHFGLLQNIKSLTDIH